MRTLIACGLGALALAACQRPADPDVDAAVDNAVDAVAMTEDAAGGSTQAGSSASAGSGSAAGGSSSGGSSSGGASNSVSRVAGERLSPADGTTAASGLANAPSMGAIDQGTRDAAKMKAEETNLHPRTP